MSYLSQLSSYLEKSKDDTSKYKVDKTLTSSVRANNNLTFSKNDDLLLSHLERLDRTNYDFPLRTKASLKDSTSSLLKESLFDRKNYEKIVQECLNFDKVEVKSHYDIKNFLPPDEPKTSGYQSQSQKKNLSVNANLNLCPPKMSSTYSTDKAKEQQIYKATVQNNQRHNECIYTQNSPKVTHKSNKKTAYYKNETFQTELDESIINSVDLMRTVENNNVYKGQTKPQKQNICGKCRREADMERIDEEEIMFKVCYDEEGESELNGLKHDQEWTLLNFNFDWRSDKTESKLIDAFLDFEV